MFIEPDRAYQYDSLPDDHIRLARILDGDSPHLCLELLPVALDETTPKFTALSYSWDAQKPTVPSLVGGKILLVTRNVASVLQHRRSASLIDEESPLLRHELFWIDAISINQTDLGERSKQVTMMRRIYETAESIVIWLGEAGSFTEDALDVVRSHVVLSGSQEEAQSRLVTDPDFVQRVWDDILRRKYWTRCWIVQEASTPKAAASTSLCCGPHHIIWDDLVAALSSTPAGPISQDDIKAPVRLLQSILEARLRRDGTLTIPFFLPYLGTLGASDVRDKIYASMQLLDHELPLVPDYERPHLEICNAFAMHTILMYRSLDVLSFAPWRSSRAEWTVPIKLSWVPRWSSTVNDGLPRRLMSLPTSIPSPSEVPSLFDGAAGSLTADCLPVSGFLIGHTEPQGLGPLRHSISRMFSKMNGIVQN